MAVHSGFWWFDALVYIMSGGAAIGLAWLLPKYIRDQYEFWRLYWSYRQHDEDDAE